MDTSLKILPEVVHKAPTSTCDLCYLHRIYLHRIDISNILTSYSLAIVYICIQHTSSVIVLRIVVSLIMRDYDLEGGLALGLVH